MLDPEKYNDRVLHEDYLRPLAHHADRAVFVVNRRDVIGDARQVAELTADLRRTLEADGIRGRPVFVVSADPPDGVDYGELEDLRSWLSERLQAKAVVTERLAADCRQRGVELARQAGLEGEQASRPLVGDDARRQARQRAVVAASSAVDVEGVRRACRRRTLAEARAAGAGPLGRLLAVVARARGGGDRGPASARSIDPVAYARAWRGRSTLSRTVNPVHDLLRRAATAAPPALRAEVMGLARPDRLEERLTEAIDGAVAQGTADHASPPRSFLWPLVGVLQTLVTVAFLAGLLWYLTLYLAGRAQADLPDLPTVGDVPVPLLLVIGSLLVGWLLARLLRPAPAEPAAAGPTASPATSPPPSPPRSTPPSPSPCPSSRQPAPSSWWRCRTCARPASSPMDLELHGCNFKVRAANLRCGQCHGRLKSDVLSSRFGP